MKEHQDACIGEAIRRLGETCTGEDEGTPRCLHRGGEAIRRLETRMKEHQDACRPSGNKRPG